jgi:hypothetical protein
MICTIRPLERPDPGLQRVAKANGFSLHAGVSCEGHQKDKRERPGGVPLCRCIARTAVAVPRLSLSSTGKVVYTLKTPYRDGTTQVVFDRGGHPPVDVIARLAALVPKPRVNLTRYHGVLASARPVPTTAGVGWSHQPGAASQARPARRGKGTQSTCHAEVRTPGERHAAMDSASPPGHSGSSAFSGGAAIRIDIEVCGRRGGAVRIIVEASNRFIEDQDVIDRILAHLERKEQNTPALPHLLPRA